MVDLKLLSEVELFAGLDPDDFEYGYYYPLEQDWADGSRLLQCTIHGWEGDLQGSVLDGDAAVTS